MSFSLDESRLAAAKPYLARVQENPTVGRVVGSVRASAVGVGSMVATTAVQTRTLIEKQTGTSLEQKALEAKLAAEEAEAWRMVLHPDGLVKTASEDQLASADGAAGEAAAAAAAAAGENGTDGVAEQKSEEAAAVSSPSGKQRRGEEMAIPPRTEHTSLFLVEKGGTITWSFRVAYLNAGKNQPLDVGFAVKLRVQGDGGSSEVDVFAMQK